MLLCIRNADSTTSSPAELDCTALSSSAVLLPLLLSGVSTATDDDLSQQRLQLEEDCSQQQRVGASTSDSVPQQANQTSQQLKAQQCQAEEQENERQQPLKAEQQQLRQRQQQQQGRDLLQQAATARAKQLAAEQSKRRQLLSRLAAARVEARLKIVRLPLRLTIAGRASSRRYLTVPVDVEGEQLAGVGAGGLLGVSLKSPEITGLTGRIKQPVDLGLNDRSPVHQP
jgi:hypothetical protein